MKSFLDLLKHGRFPKVKIQNRIYYIIDDDQSVKNYFKIQIIIKIKAGSCNSSQLNIIIYKYKFANTVRVL